MGLEPSLVLGRGASPQDVAIWSANHGGDPIATIENAHTEPILGVVSTPQQRSFISFSADLRAKVWTEIATSS